MVRTEGGRHLHFRNERAPRGCPESRGALLTCLRWFLTSPLPVCHPTPCWCPRICLWPGWTTAVAFIYFSISYLCMPLLPPPGMLEPFSSSSPNLPHPVKATAKISPPESLPWSTTRKDSSFFQSTAIPIFLCFNLFQNTDNFLVSRIATEVYFLFILPGNKDLKVSLTAFVLLMRFCTLKVLNICWMNNKSEALDTWYTNYKTLGPSQVSLLKLPLSRTSLGSLLIPHPTYPTILAAKVVYCRGRVASGSFWLVHAEAIPVIYFGYQPRI